MSLKLEKLSVVVVEDTEALCKLILSALRVLGVGKTYAAATAEDGFALFNRTKPDIIVIDWHLPGQSGLELVAQIRTSMHSADRMVPIIMMTGFSSPEKIALARDAGVTEYLVKPFSVDELIKRMVYVIQNPRDFIDCSSYFGPDRRRRKNAAYTGPYRRAEDVNLKRVAP
jgi:DNA-binding response OmpR family regulator